MHRITSIKNFRSEDFCRLIPVNLLANTANLPTKMNSTMLGCEHSPTICRHYLHWLKNQNLTAQTIFQRSWRTRRRSSESILSEMQASTTLLECMKCNIIRWYPIRQGSHRGHSTTTYHSTIETKLPVDMHEKGLWSICPISTSSRNNNPNMGMGNRTLYQSKIKNESYVQRT